MSSETADARKTREGTSSIRLVVNRKTALEESKVSSQQLRLGTYGGDSLLKFRANDDSYEQSLVTDDAADELDSPMFKEGEGFFQKAIDRRDSESTGLLALNAFIHMRDVTSERTKREMAAYFQKAFGLSGSRYKELYEQVMQSSNPVDLKLKVVVLCAEGLEAKDANGKSDPYCRMGILSRAHQSSSIVKKSNLLEWEKEGLVNEVATSSVKEATLSPVWGEVFVLPITDPKEDLLAIELWDSDEVRAKVKGVKGIGHFFRDLRKTDDFLGRTFYLLQTIPVEGEERTLTLYSHSGKHKQGEVTLKLSIQGLRKNVPIELAVHEHLMITRALIYHESQQQGQFIRRWNAKMSDAADNLLLHHASLNTINKLLRATCQLNVLLEYHKSFAVEMDAFRDILHDIKENRLLLPSYEEAADECRLTSDEPSWVVQLFKDLQELASYILDVMRNHLMVFNLKSTKGIQRIQKHIRTLKDLFTFRPFVQRLDPCQKNFTESLESCIKGSVPRWFLMLSGNLMPVQNTANEQLAAFRGLCQHCLHQCQRALENVHPIFQEVGVDYFTHFYITLDKLLYGEAASRLELFSEDPDAAAFEVYVIFKEIQQLSVHAHESVQDKVELKNCHVWFKHMVNNWIHVATKRCKERIGKAIEIDQVVQVTDEAKFSSSAVDTKAFLLQMGSFWQNLSWPVASEAYGFTVTIIQNICESALYYVETVYGSLKELEEASYDEQGRFQATEKLCIILNNMSHVRTALTNLRQKLELHKFYRWLTEKEDIGKQAEHLIDTLLSSADEDIGNKISQIVAAISKKLSPDIKQFVEGMIAAKMEDSVTEAFTPLMDYLTKNLQILGDFLLYDVFWAILHELWNVTVSTLHQSLADIPKKSRKGYLYARMYSGLNMLRDFFFAGGNGLGAGDLESTDYTALLLQLEILALPTHDVILRFQSELVKQQASAVEKRAEQKYGTLTFSVGYLRDKGAVEVTIIQGQKLPGLDKNGLSDPFVELSLQPEETFPESSEKQFRTTVQKQTLDPFYNEEFVLPANEKDLDRKGSILMLAVFDYDMMSSNDFAGLCIVACKDIPRLDSGIASLSDPDAQVRKNLVLPLIHISPTVALHELETRKEASDSEASDTWKVFKKFEADKAMDSGRKGSIFCMRTLLGL